MGTKVRKSFLGLDRNMYGCVHHDDIRQLLQVVRNDLESLLHSYGLREGSLTSILPTDVANTLYSTNHFINDVMIALNKHTSDQVSFEISRNARPRTLACSLDRATSHTQKRRSLWPGRRRGSSRSQESRKWI